VEVATVECDFEAVDRLAGVWEGGVVPALARTASLLAPAAAPVRALLINNAGSLGELAAVADLSGAAAIASSIAVNYTSTVVLNSLFLRWVRTLPPTAAPAAGAGGGSLPHTIINVSSLCAIKPFATQALYCSNKAARDMLHAVIAAEESAHPTHAVTTLNYSPGPMDTAMQAELRTSDGLAPSLRTLFRGLKDDGKLVDVHASAAACAALVAANSFTPGAHVDYYDVAGSGRT